jgi:hypothetical protein
MKNLLLVLGLAFTTGLNAQWKAIESEDDFSEKKIRFIYVEEEKDALGYYVDDNFYVIIGSYFCDESPDIYLAIFNSEGEKEIVKVTGIKIKSEQMAFTLSSEDSIKLREGSSLKIKVDESHCDNEYFEFTLENIVEAENQLK